MFLAETLTRPWLAFHCSSSGGFYTLKEHQHYRPSHHHGGGVSVGVGGGSSRRLFATSAPSGTVMMYPNPQRGTALAPSVGSGTGHANTAGLGGGGGAGGAGGGATGSGTGGQPDISLRQRAVAKLRMFNFHLNWDLHMTHCKPCGWVALLHFKK